MLNYKIKSHRGKAPTNRGKAPTNRTDALCIIELENEIKRVFACIIPDKREMTIVPIICSQVAFNTTIWTDEHRAYSNLKEFDYTHGTVCHKYEFIKLDTGANTQAVEFFNNLLKKGIKSRMGFRTEERENLLKEVFYYFNNRTSLFRKNIDFD
ncbi:hypothetical protein DMUE_4485 [Dictyocoela muelleri]|nr:hypothetical protein DMUE_4485 [Dictyocoela muelleri]